LTNALNACTNAAKGGRAVLVVTTDGSGDGGPLGYDHKLIPTRELAAALGLRYVAPQAKKDVVEAVREAHGSAEAGEATLLVVPINVLGEDGVERRPASERQVRTPIPPAIPSGADVEAIVAALQRSERPLVLAGRGAAVDETRALLVTLAERRRSLLGTSLLAKSLFRGHPRDVGVVGGFAFESTRRVLSTVDCVVAFGASLNIFTRGHHTLFNGATIVQVDHDPDQLGRFGRVDVAVAGDAGATAGLVLDGLGPARSAVGFDEDELQALRSTRLVFGNEEAGGGDHVDPRAIVVAFDELLPEDRLVLTDGGHNISFPGTALDVPKTGGLRLTNADFGSIGLGLGAAIGAAVADPELTIVLFIGDGGLRMTLGELQTAANLRCRLVIAVMNDQAFGAERHFLELDGIAHHHSQFPDTDFAAVAAALGIESVTVRSVADLRRHAPRLEGRESPFLLDCKIDPAVRARWFEDMHALQAKRRAESAERGA
jgi:thiamine pyrophosphate-dependent acetolactate synthase large subunit-like protein